MDKRYQVFISSTFKDLQEERQAALKAVLELNHMPAGMELFPAADDSAWELIKDVIESSDYYVLIMGGRYGSLDEERLGYTEKEYDFAVSGGKPVVPLLHENPGSLPRNKTETDRASWRKLQEFREKVEKSHTCAYWSSSEELKAKLIIGLTSTVKRNPATGWIRADQVPSRATIKDLLVSRQRVEELESQLKAERVEPPPGTEDLMQGDNTLAIKCTFSSLPLGGRTMTYSYETSPSWNEIFAGVAPTMIMETADNELKRSLDRFFARFADSELAGFKEFKGAQQTNFKFDDDVIVTCIVQLRALGLITESRRKRSLRDARTYWTLTPYGDLQMTRLRALRRTPPPSRKKGAKPARSKRKKIVRKGG